MTEPAACSVDGCDLPVKAKGYCRRHYWHNWRHGRPTPLSFPERFWTKVDRGGPDECWPWLGNKNEKGYGTFREGPKVKKAHRIAYELLVGPIPDGLEPDHLCRVRCCVNPSHLEPVTHAENVRRGVHARAES